MKIHLSSAAAGGCLSAKYISQVSYWLGILGEGDQLTFFFFQTSFLRYSLKVWYVESSFIVIGGVFQCYWGRVFYE